LKEGKALFLFALLCYTFYIGFGDDMNNQFKRKLATIGVFIALTAGYLGITEPHYDASYEILEDDPAFAKCSCGTVYIGNKEFLQSIPDGEDVVLVEDLRNRRDDPNMKIYHSCRFSNRDDRNTILEILQCYEELDPSEWDRSIESMRLEWFMHNLFYNFRVEEIRTEDVDLDNNDEEKFQQKILQILFRL